MALLNRTSLALLVIVVGCGGAAQQHPTPVARSAPPPPASTTTSVAIAVPPVEPILPPPERFTGCKLASPHGQRLALRPSADKPPFAEVIADRVEVTLGTAARVDATAIVIGGKVALRGMLKRSELALFAATPFRFGGMIEPRGAIDFVDVDAEGTVSVSVTLPEGVALDGERQPLTHVSCNQLGLDTLHPEPLGGQGWANGPMSATPGGPVRVTGFSGAAKRLELRGGWARVVIERETFFAYGWIPKSAFDENVGGMGHGWGTGGARGYSLAVNADDIACPEPIPVYVAYGDHQFATAGTLASHASFHSGDADGEFTAIDAGSIDTFTTTKDESRRPLHLLTKTRDLAGCTHSQIGSIERWRR